MRSIYIFFLCIFQFTGITSLAQNRDTERLTKEIIKIIKKESLVRNEIDWAKLHRDLKAINYSGNYSKDRYLVFATFIKILNSSGDFHSLFVTQQLRQQIVGDRAEAQIPTSEYLGNGTGYLKIPKSWNFDFQEDLAFTDSLISQIQSLDEFEIDNWIIDLRGNAGGNGWPMLAGLIPIIGDGLVGYNVMPKKSVPYSIEKGYILYSKVETKIYNVKKSYKKIAVMIDERTSSSGEMVALSILGFENTKSFGEKSSGLTTYNTGFGFFNDPSIFYLATGIMADKNMKVYKDGISPDFPLSNTLSEKEKIDQILIWLTSN